MIQDGPPGGGRLALFADCLVVGLLTLVASMPLVTGYAALTAGCAVLRGRILADHPAGPRAYWIQLRAVLATGAAVLWAPLVTVAVLALDLVAVAAGVPGHQSMAVLLALAGAAAAVLGLRVAAGWRAGLSWSWLARLSAARAVRDPGGSALLLLAAGAAGVVAAAVPITVFLLPGLLALAAVVVDLRGPAAGRIAPVSDDPPR